MPCPHVSTPRTRWRCRSLGRVWPPEFSKPSRWFWSLTGSGIDWRKQCTGSPYKYESKQKATKLLCFKKAQLLLLGHQIKNKQYKNLCLRTSNTSAYSCTGLLPDRKFSLFSNSEKALQSRSKMIPVDSRYPGHVFASKEHCCPSYI